MIWAKLHGYHLVWHFGDLPNIKHGTRNSYFFLNIKYEDSKKRQNFTSRTALVQSYPNYRIFVLVGDYCQVLRHDDWRISDQERLNSNNPTLTQELCIVRLWLLDTKLQISFQNNYVIFHLESDILMQTFIICSTGQSQVFTKRLSYTMSQDLCFFFSRFQTLKSLWVLTIYSLFVNGSLPFNIISPTTFIWILTKLFLNLMWYLEGNTGHYFSNDHTHVTHLGHLTFSKHRANFKTLLLYFNPIFIRI